GKPAIGESYQCRQPIWVSERELRDRSAYRRVALVPNESDHLRGNWRSDVYPNADRGSQSSGRRIINQNQGPAQYQNRRRRCLPDVWCSAVAISEKHIYL